MAALDSEFIAMSWLGASGRGAPRLNWLLGESGVELSGIWMMGGEMRSACT